MQKKFSISSNPFFSLPFLVWAIIGGLLLVFSTRQSLFLFINNHNSPFADVFMCYATWLGEAIIVIPILLALFIFKRFRNFKYFFAALFCNILPFLIQQSLKSLFNMPRPMNYYLAETWHIHYIVESGDPLYQRSFPSGHTVGAFSLFCFLSLLLPGKYRQYGLLFFFIALLVGYSRIYLAAHFFEDVYVGSILGWVTTTIVFSVMNKFNLVP